MKNQKGITLIALIITIIVMLILVAVSVSVVINSDLIGTADDAGNKTKQHYTNESLNTFGEYINVAGNMVNVADYGNTATTN